MPNKTINNVGELKALIADLPDNMPLVFWSSGVFHEIGNTMKTDDVFIAQGEGGFLTTGSMIKRDNTLKHMDAASKKKKKPLFHKLGKALIIG